MAVGVLIWRSFRRQCKLKRRCQMRTKRLQGMLEMVFVIMLATIYMYVVGAIVVIEMLVDEKDDRERHRVVKLVIKEWRKAKNAEPEICESFIAVSYTHLTLPTKRIV